MKHVNIKINNNQKVEDYLEESGNMRKTVEKALELAIEFQNFDEIKYENNYLKIKVNELIKREKELLDIIKTSVTQAYKIPMPQTQTIIKEVEKASTEIKKEITAEETDDEVSDEISAITAGW